MPKLSVSIGVMLIILGLMAYYITDAVSITALIPAFFGIVFTALGFLGQKSDSMRKHSMHAALLLALLGLGGSFGGLNSIIGILFGQNPPARLNAAISQATMALLCLAFIVTGLKSFIKARKKNS